MNWLQRKAAILFRLSPESPEGWTAPSDLSDSGEAITQSSALALSAVWACTNLIAGTTASVPLVVYRSDTSGARVVAKDHPLYRLLHDSPNYDQSAMDFWEFMAASQELWGDSFADITRTGDRITALTPVRADIVDRRRLSSGDIEYRWTEDGKHRVRLQRDMLHIRGFGGSPLGGMSTLQFGRHAFGIARATDRSASSTFRNGMRPSGVLTYSEFLSDDQYKLADERLTKKFVGSVNAGRPMILEGGTSWTPLTINPTDAQMLESRRFSVEEICRFFGVPPHMIGHTEKSTSWGTGIEQQTLAFVKFTLRRRLKRIEQALSKQLLTAADRAAGIVLEFSLEGLLRGDSKGRAAFYTSMTSIGAMTINEVRRLENLPPVDGGDQPRMQMQNVPITDAGQKESDNGSAG